MRPADSKLSKVFCQNFFRGRGNHATEATQTDWPLPHDAKNLYPPFSLQKFNCGCGGARILSLFVSHRAPKAEICNKELGIQETAKRKTIHVNFLLKLP